MDVLTLSERTSGACPGGHVVSTSGAEGMLLTMRCLLLRLLPAALLVAGCSTNTAIPECFQDRDCPNGQVCESHLCVAPPDTQDGGGGGAPGDAHRPVADATVRDAGAPARDATGADSTPPATDASRPDAAPDGAGRVDARGPGADAALRDASRPLADAAGPMPDTGLPPDAGGAAPDAASPLSDAGRLPDAAGMAPDAGPLPDAAAPPCAGEGCDCRPQVLGDRLYTLCTQPRSFDAARAECQRRGLDLAHVDSADENAALADLLRRTGAGGIWIGLTDTAVEGTYVWIDGVATPYTHWGPGEPVVQGDADCVRLAAWASWSVTPCGDANAALCEGPLSCDVPLAPNTPCSVGLGACHRNGTEACEGGLPVCSATAGLPAPETCDGVDNDCNGRVDEMVVDGGAPCAAGVGACRRPGSQICVNGALSCDATPGPPTAELCNGVDDDCDSQVDEDLVDCVVCDGREGVPCNGCPVGTVVPPGWVCIPAGDFTMGSPIHEIGRGALETQHPVTLEHAFLMKATEATQGEWSRIYGHTPSYFSSCGDDCPVEEVGWFDAVDYLDAISTADGLEPCYPLQGCQGFVNQGCSPGQTGCGGIGFYACRPVDPHGIQSCTGYRLPTEAEWEYAARAGTGTALWSGALSGTGCVPPDANLIGSEWYCGDAAVNYFGCFDLSAQGGPVCGGTHPVGVMPPNPWGLYDILGNVSEWVSDEWDGVTDYDPGPATDPVGASGLGFTVVRGGSWFDNAESARAAFRLARGAMERQFSLGFRPVRTVPPRLPGGCPAGPAPEICDGLDNDCDGRTDEGACDVVCDGGAAPPCNGCPAGTPVPAGFVCAPAGVFTMGSPQMEPGRTPQETLHPVTLARPFLIGATELTQGQWFALMGNRPARFPDCGDDCPVEQVSWYDGAAYLNALSAQAHLDPCYALAHCSGTPGAGDFVCDPPDARTVRDCAGYRYPTEAEWEYATRANTRTAFWSGALSDRYCGADESLAGAGWYCGNGGDVTHPGGAKAANPWGLYDVHGNVFEWVNDAWDGADYAVGPAQDPAGPAAGRLRLFRGGASMDLAQNARAASRGSGEPTLRTPSLGLRPVRSILP